MLSQTVVFHLFYQVSSSQVLHPHLDCAHHVATRRKVTSTPKHVSSPDESFLLLFIRRGLFQNLVMKCGMLIISTDQALSCFHDFSVA